MKMRALVLFAHGAREPRWAVPFQRLKQSVQAQLQDVTVSLAFLELMTPRLPELIQQLEEIGHTEITIVPVFFGQGGHVLRDLPVIVNQLRAAYPHVIFKVADAVGEDAEVLQAITKYCVDSLIRE